MANISINETIPPRSRTFTQDDATAVLMLLQGEAEGQDGTPAKNVGFGTFPTAGAARSAGVTLNRLLSDLGAPHKYAVTTLERDGQYVGVMLNKQAKAAPPAAGEGETETPRRRSRG